LKGLQAAEVSADPLALHFSSTFGPLQKLAQELGVPEYEPANHLLDDRFFDNLSGQQAYIMLRLSSEKGLGDGNAERF
jgi:hypothetical protein